MHRGRVFYFIILAICIFETARLWHITPSAMAAHFNVAGNPDRFVSKPEFFSFQIQTLLVVIVVSILPQIVFLVLPVNLINMPNREYWLAPERRADTLDRITSFGMMMFGVILLAVQAAFEFSVYANLQAPIRFNAQGMFGVMIVAFVVIGLLMVKLILSFRLPAEHNKLS